MRVLPLGMLIGFVAGIAFAEMVRADIHCADYGYTVQCNGANVKAWGFRTPYGKSFTIRQIPDLMNPNAYGGTYKQHDPSMGLGLPMFGFGNQNRGFTLD